MLKITSIVSSIIFLLFLGTGSYARTLVKQSQQKLETAKEKQEEKEDSLEKGDFDDEPSETIHRLDFYHGFSLVNAQLRWKEFHMEKQGKSLRNFSKKLHVEQDAAYEVTETLDMDIQALEIPEASKAFYATIGESKDAVLATYPRNSKYQANRIAFIQNCGTYPHFLS